MRPGRSKKSQHSDNSRRDRNALRATDTAPNLNETPRHAHRSWRQKGHNMSDNTENTVNQGGEGLRSSGEKSGRHGHGGGRGRGTGRRRAAMHAKSGGPEGGKGRGRGKRPLRHGDLRYLILSLIEDTPRHGYEMITLISERTKGGYNPSPGVIYPALELLQDLGWTNIREDSDKKLYALTDDGKAALAENADRVTAINERLDRFGQEDSPNTGDSVKTAFQRLRHEVKSRLNSGKVDEAKRGEIVKLLDQTREHISKLG